MVLPMDDITRQKLRLQKLVTDGRVSKYALAKRAGFHKNVLDHMLKDRWNPTSDVLAALVRAADSMDFPKMPRRRGKGSQELAA